jgi:SAM-dependent methyltransferase
MAEQAAVGTEKPQQALWNGRSGEAWVAEQALLDRLLQPFETLLVSAAAETGARDLLDVGCGTGATTLAAARRLGSGARCTGVDISAPMLALARKRAEQDRLPARFILADAEDHPFPPAAFDLILSRFGVMFFADPVAAFANLRRAARPGGALRFFVWRGPEDNPYMTTAERAAAPFLDLPPRSTDAPGQFAFARQECVRRILAESGWREIAVEPLDIECRMTEAELEAYFTRLGPVGMAIDDADPDTRLRIVAAARAAFAPFVENGEVRFIAACWSVAAQA